MTTRVRLKYWNAHNMNPYIGDFVVTDANYKRSLNENGSFDFSIPISALKGKVFDFSEFDAGDLFSDPFHTSTVLVELYRNGKLLIDGVLDSVSIDYVGQDLSYKFLCSGEMWSLANSRALSVANYQDLPILDILTDLLTQIPPFAENESWAIGDVRTMQDITVRTTIDLRGEKRRLPQIRKLLESIPNLFFRYGGRDSRGRRLLDIGFFNTKIYPHIFSNEIEDLEQTLKFSDQIGAIESYGGEVTIAGTTRKLNLNDALTYDPELQFLSEDDLALFPIVPGSGSYGALIVRSSTLPSQKVEIYSEIVPTTKIDPSSDELGQAGIALWRRTCAELAQIREPLDEWRAKIQELPENFTIGDQIYLDASAHQTYYDFVSGKTFSLEIGRVKQWFRSSSFSASIKNDKTDYSVAVSTNVRLEKTDSLVALYETVRQKPEEDSGSPSAPHYAFLLTTFNVATGQTANALGGNVADTHPAILIDVPLPTPPIGASGIIVYATFSLDDSIVIELAKQPEITDTLVQLIVSRGKNWTVDDSCTVYILTEYTDDIFSWPL